jgi:ElaB/YqjD/DUF883 family membrane-anchored ribosome-binding protein
MTQNSSTRSDSSHPTSDRVSDGITMARDAVVDTANNAKDTAQAVVQTAADTIDHNRGIAARVLAEAASTIHDGAARLPGGPGVARLADAAAEQVDATANYVREHDTQQMVADLRHFVRRHPGASVLGAAVLGVLVGRGFRNR